MKYLLLLAGTLFFMSGCIHDNFDEPSGNGEDPDIDPNLVISIDDLKNLYNGADAVELTDSVFISGIIIADDKSGNFYQTIVIEDETSGIAIRLGVNSYYNTYPIGRRLFVLLKGLYIGQYNGLVQMGVQDPDELDGVERIPALLIDSYFFPGQFNLDISPAVVSYADLNANRNQYQNRLIQLDNMEFASYHLGETMADAANQQTENRDLDDCDGNDILLRNSGFADFAGDSIPCGNGSIVAVFSVFGSDNQLLIRDGNDVQFTSVRCDGTTPVICGGAPLPCPVQTAVDGSSEDFQTAELFDPINLNGWKSVSAIGSAVYEARDFDNNLYAQVQGFGSGSAAVEAWLVSPKINFDMADNLSFDSKIGFWKHDGLKVFISTDFDGCDPLAATWTELSGTIANTSNSPDGVSGYSANFVSSGNIDLTSYTGTGYIGFQYIGNDQDQTTTYQIDNIVIGDPVVVNPPDGVIDEDFETIGTTGNFALTGWENIPTIGTEAWEGRFFDLNTYPQASGFQSTSTNIEIYLITPQFDLSMGDMLSFDTKIAFCNHEGLKVYISTDYTGNGMPLTASWTELSAIIANPSNSDCVSGFADDFINSGNVDLSSFTGMANIAFVYRGNNSTETTTYQVDNVLVQ